MPLVRVEVRNEYGLGMPELYTETNREDPKAVLDGVAVAGLVGILRQLGDLAEFAAEIFHGLQEQVLITSSRSHKLVERVHNIEAALPPLEKAILGQRSHLHFAYTAGSHWHTRLRTEQNHFIYSDLPRCIMDSYEDCRDPPRLHKLDKFDIGGPGSCFRRYSDPTYFKRTSAGPYEAHLQSIPREKKARRNKKKRSSLRYRDVTHGAPIIMHRETDFGSSKFEEKAPPSHDISTFHDPQKPGIEPEIDHLTCFDSTNGSAYIECIFRPSYSTQSEDNNNAKELPPDSHLHQNSYLDSGENSGVPDEENINNSYLAEDSSSKSPYITWDEKLEIIDSINESTEIPCTTEKMNDEEKEDLNPRDDERVIDFDDFREEPPPTLVTVGGLHDEIESETDYYMDALNTIESESETDLDCQTKRELKQFSNVNNNDVEEINNKESHLDNSNSSRSFEFYVPEHTSLSISPESHMEAIGSSNNVADRSLTSTTISDKFETRQAERNVTNTDTNILDGTREPHSRPLSNENTLSTYESPEPSLSTSGGQTTVSNPVMFWTNGGLLGLEPSKPPDFGLPNVVEETKTNATQHSDQSNTRNDMLVNASKSESSTKLLPGSNGFSSVQDNDGNAKDDPINSSRIFEFSNRLLVNGLRKQISLVGNERLASSVKTDVPENTAKGYQTITKGIPFREQFGNGTSLVSSPSSPPLEHMRISFQPIDGFETCKLKLTFPDPDGNDNNYNNERNKHMFPSFQLVPEPAISAHEFASDSDDDDDTFCRSSPYASDDCHSHLSESNSEQWDSSDSPRIRDREIDDAFGRISSAESVSSSIVNGIRFQQSSFTDNGMQHSQNGFLFNIPKLDSMKNASHNNETNDLKEPTPPPPPLPPMEWRGIKPHPSVTMENEGAFSEALSHALNLTPSEPILPQQPKPSPTEHDHFVKTDDSMLRHKQPDWQNLHLHNESKMNRKVGEEKEDFLQQIRTKSLNLRRTSTARPNTSTPAAAGPTSVKVTAILEKATAIRQAVASDDGEDDAWSDT